MRAIRVSTGSSPRARGKRSRSCPPRTRRRIIPARAGQTDNITRLRGLRLDHPRACGANERQAEHMGVKVGSSPRVRGKLIERTAERHGHRIIPARAGQTSSGFAPAGPRPDHPRACGANDHWPNSSLHKFGSSPRVRGKPQLVPPVACKSRIIPARAGQTRTPTWLIVSAPDHPRACGANVAVFRVLRGECGSSPRVRGKPYPRLAIA